MFLRVFDKSHNILDELYNFSSPVLGWTLNDIDTLEFNLSLIDPKTNEQNIKFLNHLEVIDENNNILWGGVITGHSFDYPTLKINCCDYNYLLKNRRLKGKEYPTLDYGALLSQMILDTNAISTTGVTIGSIETVAQTTTRIIKDTDFLFAKIKDFGDDINSDYWVDNTRKFNFSSRRGADKPQYLLEYGGEGDNILNKPNLAIDILSTTNNIYSEAEADGTKITCIVGNQESVNFYGLLEGTFTPSDGVTEQTTLNNQTAAALERSAFPVNSFSVNIKDSNLCPFNDLYIGDSVTVSLRPYFGFKSMMRIIKMSYDIKNNTRELTFGNIIFRPQPPQKRQYKY